MYLISRPKREAVIYSNATIPESFSEKSKIKTAKTTRCYIEGLHHYTSYDIFVNTCRYEPENQTVTEECSERDAWTTFTTLPKGNKDNY